MHLLTHTSHATFIGATLPLGDTVVTQTLPAVLKMSHHNEDLHRKSHSLLMLLTLVTAINNGGRPNLPGHSGSYQMLPDRELPTYEEVLNAIAILLVQDAEVVAVTACPLHDNPASGQRNSFQVWALQQGPQVNYPATEGVQFGKSP